MSEELPASRTSAVCPGCRAEFPAVEGPTHAYIESVPGCWAVYTEILAKEYGELRYPECHRLTVDAYAVQHPGTPSRKSIQSVAGHLISLHLVLERGLDAVAATRALARLADARERLEWLEPPAAPEWKTVLDVLGSHRPGAADAPVHSHRPGAADATAHDWRVRQWADSVWRAWAAHHELVRKWAARA